MTPRHDPKKQSLTNLSMLTIFIRHFSVSYRAKMNLDPYTSVEVRMVKVREWAKAYSDFGRFLVAIF
jgi:hypothetical protein